jgi:hypothetical protein
MSSYDVLVDPHLLCIPNPCGSADQLEGFLTCLKGWIGFLDNDQVTVLLSDSVRFALADDGVYPDYNELKQLLMQVHVELFDIKSAWSLITTILSRAPCLEEHFGVLEVSHRQESMKCEPDAILSRLRDRCRRAFEADLVMAAIHLACVNSPDSTEIPVVAAVPFLAGLQPTSLNVDAEVIDILQVAEPPTYCLTLPTQIAEQIAIAFGPEAINESLTLWEEWKNAASEEAVFNTITRRVDELRAQGVGSGKQSFVLGPHFVESLQKWGASSRRDYAMVTVESCARIVLDVPKNEVKPFRVSEAANADQVSRDDKAVGFRTHLTKSGVGLRLMLWVHSDGTIEFANIGGKGELVIQ